MEINSKCGLCKVRAYSEKYPKSAIAVFWRMHTKCCPQWKAYHKALVERLKWATQETLISGLMN